MTPTPSVGSRENSATGPNQLFNDWATLNGLGVDSAAFRAGVEPTALERAIWKTRGGLHVRGYRPDGLRVQSREENA
ncbi:hypothetical protein GCM10023068_39850 [Leifsonia shinshuensis]|uniref:Uncharacterized protein n=1 Tax=Leifsonia shinshuensis TaxID=150026 RepID=A0A853CYI0_9MICO|nr:hypothetical protein [Leifsonia shinshuensis]